MEVVTYQPHWVEPLLDALHDPDHTPRSAARRAGTTLAAVTKYRGENEEFNEAYLDAIGNRADAVEREMYRRAVDGIEKGVYYMGDRVATELQYSDTLLVKLAEAYLPEKFSPKVAHQHIHDGNITVHVREFPVPTAAAESIIDAEFRPIVDRSPMDFV